MPPSCPACGKSLKGKFTWIGWLWAILCFPCGIFCCFRHRRLRCDECEKEVIISDGTVPALVKQFKCYDSFKWQFVNKERPPLDSVVTVAQSPAPEANGTTHDSEANGTAHDPVREV